MNMQTLKLYETMRNVPKPTKYINPMIDWAFKKIFKDSGNKQLLIRPLNGRAGHFVGWNRCNRLIFLYLQRLSLKW